MHAVRDFRPKMQMLYVRLGVAAFVGLIPTIVVCVLLLRPGNNWVVASLASAGAFLVFGFLPALFQILHFPTIRYQINDRYLVNAHGRVWKAKRSTPLEKITNVDVSQGPLERFLGVGKVGVFTPSTGSLRPEVMLIGVDDPHECKAFLIAQAEQLKAGDASSLNGNYREVSDEFSASSRVLQEILGSLRNIEALLKQK